MSASVGVPFFDAVIVGSGPAGVSAAFPLVQAGWRVAMLDGGRQASLDPPQEEFMQWRRQAHEQWRWMVGTDFHALRRREAVSPKLRVPTQAYAFDGFEQGSRVQGEAGFVALGSLATGGLSNAWGCGVSRFNVDEGRFPFAADELDASYATVARRVGISGGGADDLSEAIGLDEHSQPPLPFDPLHASLWSRYQRRRPSLLAQGVRVGRSRVAVLSQPRGERGACNLSGNCLYGCARQAIWSAAQDLPALRREPRFRWMPEHIVEGMRPLGPAGWEVQARTGSGIPVAMQARRVLLGAGTLATTRLAMQALGIRGPLPMLSCPTAAFLLWLPGMLGTPRAPGFGLGQLSYTIDLPQGGAGFGSTFQTTSVPAWDLARHLPLNRPAGMRLLRHLLPSCLVGNLFLPGDLGDASVRLDAHGTLLATGTVPPRAEAALDDARTRLSRAWRAIGACMLPGSFTVGRPGSDIHYAGTLPMSSRPQPGCTSPEGEVHGLPGVHVIDGACLPALPGKSHTLTLMANADRIGRRLAGGTHP